MSILILPQEKLPLADALQKSIPNVNLKGSPVTHVRENSPSSFETLTSSPSLARTTTSATPNSDGSSDISLRKATQPLLVPASQSKKTSAATFPAPISAPFISSPYLEPSHLLDLATLDIQSSLLARALIALEPVTPLYATTTYSEALNWPTIFAHLEDLCSAQNYTWTAQSFYVVEFRSKLRVLTPEDRALLFDLDKYSHAEANISGGLLKYWYGSPDTERRNLATCESTMLSVQGATLCLCFPE